MPSPVDGPSTAHNHNERRTPTPQPTSVQTGGSSSHPSVLEYTLHSKRVYDAKNIWGEGARSLGLLSLNSLEQYYRVINLLTLTMI